MQRKQKRKVAKFFTCEEVPRQTVSSAMVKGFSRRSCEHKWSSHEVECAGGSYARRPDRKSRDPVEVTFKDSRRGRSTTVAMTDFVSPGRHSGRGKQP